MAASAASRSLRQPDRRRERAATSVRRRKTSKKTAESAAAEQVEPVVDIDELRRARSNFYARHPEERRRDERETMAREEVRKVKVDGSRRLERKASTSSHSARSSHHRRRRKTPAEKEAADGEYVYKAVEDDVASPRLVRRSSERRASPVEERRSSFIPDRLKVLRSAGREAPRRSTSQRTVPRPSHDEEHRRHSCAGSSSRTAERSPREHARVVEMNEARSSGPKRFDYHSATLDEAHSSRSVSLRDSRSSTSRPPLQRSQTSVRKVRRLSEAMPSVAEETRSQGASPTKRPASVFGSLFGPATRRPSGPEPKVTCLTCADDVRTSRAAKLSCGHEMCHDCLKRIFSLSVTDPSHMPPKCCTADHINLKHVEKLFDDRFKRRWNRKYQEYTTKNRLYCPAKGCGSWIPPRDIHKDSNSSSSRKYGKCPRCKTKVCAACNGKWHTSRTCPNDEATLRFAEIAKQEGWQRCFNCSAMVELKEGCNHMTCRCTAEFCMICGVKWKSCDCPWFNYAAVENDRLNHMNVPQARRVPVGLVGAARQPRAYQEELEQRREQERHDEALARRLQGLDLAPIGLGPNVILTRQGLHDAGGNINAVDDFTLRAADLLTRPNDAANQAAARRLVAGFRARQRDGRGDEWPTAVANVTVSPPPPPPPPPQIPLPPVLPAVRVSPIRPEQWQRPSAASPARRTSVRRATDRNSNNNAAPISGGRAHIITMTEPPKSSSSSKLWPSSVGRGGSGGRGGPGPSPQAQLWPTRRRPAAAATEDEEEEEGEDSGAESESGALSAAADSEEKGEDEEADVWIRPAELAGLNRRSTTGRVDAWRRHVGVGAGCGSGGTGLA